MRDRIWTEMTHAKHSDEFASLYSERQRLILRYFNIGILVFSSAGVMGWTIWKTIPFIACIVIAAISLLRLIQPHIVMTDNQISNLDNIQKFYANYYNKLERLWYDLEENRITDHQATELFFTIKDSENDINPIVSETLRRKPKSIKDKSKQHSDEYFKKVFNA